MTDRSLVPYRLPDGRLVAVDASAAKDARLIDYTMADGTIVLAVQASEHRRTCALLVALWSAREAFISGAIDREELARRIQQMWDEI